MPPGRHVPNAPPVHRAAPSTGRLLHLRRSRLQPHPSLPARRGPSPVTGLPGHQGPTTELLLKDSPKEENTPVP